MNKIKIRTILFFCVAMAVVTDNCAAVDTKREGEILKRYSEENKDKYGDLLVDITKYTTNGAQYHEKYRKLLIGLAGEIIEVRKYAIVPGSIGFYFDKKMPEKTDLYLGLDIDAGNNLSETYSGVATYLIKQNLREIIETVRLCVSIFSEKEVIGMVVGWRWTSGSKQEQVNIWMSKEDLIKYEEKKLTFEELVIRSVITNTEGLFIRVSL